MHLKRLSIDDGIDVFDMLQDIGAMENSFSNPVNGMDYSEFKSWLAQQDKWRNGIDLPDGYVAQTIYWLIVEGAPVGVGKIRHALTEESRNSGGNIGYAISRSNRGHGYGSVLLRLLINEARRMQLDEILLTVDKNNFASKKVIEKNGGVVFSENEKRWYFHV